MSVEFRQRLFVIVNTNQSLGGRIFSLAIVALIVVNIAAMVFETLPGANTNFWQLVETVSVIIFTIEIGLRVYVADLLYPELSPSQARWKYFRSPLAIVDTLAVIYFYLPFIFRLDLRSLRALRLLRLFKVVKFARHSSTINRLGRAIRDQRQTLLATVGAIVFVVLVASSLVYSAEDQAGSVIFSNIFDALWWGAKVLVAGEGGIEPTTTVGRLVTLIIAMAGIALIAVPTGIITAEFLDEIEQANEQDSPVSGQSKSCQHCRQTKN